MRSYLDAARRGDVDAAVAFLADDLVVHIPGRSRWAGTHHGKAAFVEYVREARALSAGGHVDLELVDMLASDERVALLVRERFVLPGRTVDIRRANVYRVAGDRIVEITIHEGDQYDVDALFDAAATGAP